MAVPHLASIAALTLLAVVLASPAGAADEPLNAWCPMLPDEAVDPDDTSVYAGFTVGFCCRSCKTDFDAEPEAYVADIPELVAALAAREPGAAANRGGPAEPAPDSGADEEFMPRWFGKMHVIVVHFPLALLLAAALAEALALARRRPAAGEAATFCLWAGAATAFVASFMGWTRAETWPVTLAETADTLFWHRWLGAGAFVLGALAVLAGARVRLTARSQGVLLYRVLLLVTAIVVAATGHNGGVLVHGRGYLFG